MITRKQYLDGNATHDEYYGEIAALVAPPIRAGIIDRVRVALDEGDKHLNTIPLALWDSMAFGINPSRVREVLKERGDGYSMSSGVCILKAAAKAAVNT